MNLHARVRAIAKSADRVVQTRPVASMGVCERIKELTRLYSEHPPVFRPGIEDGIAAGVARDEQTWRDNPDTVLLANQVECSI